MKAIPNSDSDSKLSLMWFCNWWLRMVGFESNKTYLSYSLLPLMHLAGHTLCLFFLSCNFCFAASLHFLTFLSSCFLCSCFLCILCHGWAPKAPKGWIGRIFVHDSHDWRRNLFGSAQCVPMWAGVIEATWSTWLETAETLPLRIHSIHRREAAGFIAQNKWHVRAVPTFHFNSHKPILARMPQVRRVCRASISKETFRSLEATKVTLLQTLQIKGRYIKKIVWHWSVWRQMFFLSNQPRL